MWTVRDSPAHVSTAFSTIHGLVFHGALSHQQPPDQAMPHAPTGPVTSAAALKPPANATGIPVTGSDEDSPWSADEDSGLAGAAFGDVDYVIGPVAMGPAEPEQAEQSVTQVSSSCEQLQDTALKVLHRGMSVDESAQLIKQPANGPGMLQDTAQLAPQPVAELTQQLLAEQLPGNHTPVPQQAAAAAVAVVAASSTDVGVTAETLSAAPATGHAETQDASPEEGAQPHSSTPLYTCHLQSLGDGSLALLRREDAFGAGAGALPLPYGAEHCHPHSVRHQNSNC